MSSSLNVYLEDVSQVQACYGCKHEFLRAGVLRQFKSEIARYDKWFAGYELAGAPSLGDALGDIIAGEIRRPKFGAQYGYALLMLCKYLGTEISNEWFKDFRSGWLERVKFILTLVESGPPVPIPAAEDFLLVGFFTADRVKAEHRYLRGGDLSDQTQEVVLARREYIEWLEDASRRGKGLISFSL